MEACMNRSRLMSAAAALVVAAGLAVVASPPAALGARTRAAAPRLPAGERQVCPLSTLPGIMSCQAVLRRVSGTRSNDAGRTSPVSQYGYSPASLRSAYGLVRAAARGGRGETVAVVDAYSDPDLVANLAVYRRQFRLPPCSLASRCLRILNQDGKPAPLPAANADWALEESLDLDMVSAICPSCRIVLVEASYPSILNLSLAEQTAAATGARFINNSWSGAEFVGENSFDKYFDHPGDAVSVASGDDGYAVGYPAASQYVTAVGGTTLLADKRARRHWRERAWGNGGVAGREGSSYYVGSGSGCSMLEPKPSWQREKVDDSAAGCLNRTENDVAADADPVTGVAVYDSFADGGTPWQDAGGTSVATALITATYALAGTPAPGTYPASYPYLHPRSLFHVVGGNNGTCEASRRYLCWGTRGYNGPTGLGTPDGVGAFADHGARPVTLADPGTQDVAGGARFRLRIAGLDARQQASSLDYSATGLPAGLSIHAPVGSTDAVIAGVLPAAPATAVVTVTARDPVSGQAGSVRFMIVSVASLTRTGAAAGRVSLHDTGICLDAGPGTAGSAVTVEDCDATAAERWIYTAGTAPGAYGTLSAGSQCLGRAGAQLTLDPCQPRSAAQGWVMAGDGRLRNAEAGGCLRIARMAAGQRVRLGACNQAGVVRWTLPSGLLVAGGSGLCAEDAGGTDVPLAVQLARCAASASDEQIMLHADGGIEVGGDCFDVPGPTLIGSSLDGAAVVQNFCGENEVPAQVWLIGPGGELINNYSGKCLDDPAGGGAGTSLVQEDCYGLPGEIWAVN
jgi:ricin-type beta-trefoil lectin protein/subtilase family protein